MDLMPNTATANVSPRMFRLLSPVMLLGLVFYPVNYTSDMLTGIPVGDLLLPFGLIFVALRSGYFSKIAEMPGFVPGALFIGWVILANMVNGVAFGEQVRLLFVLTTLLLPVFCYMVLLDKDKVMEFMTGAIIGFGLYFMFFALMDLAQTGGFSRTLRGVQSTPVVAFALLAMFHSRQSKPVQWALAGTALFSLMVGVVIAARGPMVAVLLVPPLAALIWFCRKMPWVPALVCVAALMGHWIFGLLNPDLYSSVLVSTQDTLSNRERAYLIDYCLMQLQAHPWFGISYSTFAVDFADYFAWIDNFRREVDAVKSPHNSFLEYATFYGFPAAFLFLASLFSILKSGIRTTINPWVAAAVVAGLIRLGAFYGFGGWLRIEWFALLCVLLYALPLWHAVPEEKLPVKR